MKLLILGGGSCQLNAIKRAKEKGHTVIVTDYYPDAPGKRLADYQEMASTFDFAACLKVAQRYQVDGVMTSGTDQPVYTVARIVENLGLPALVNCQTARAVTNKKEMKRLFSSGGIPTVKYRFLSKGFAGQELAAFNFPVVVKPLDSQGQRGVYKLQNIREVREKLPEVLSYSREKEILIEEYYKSDEITISGWVEKGELYLLTVTDRIGYQNKEHIGICTAHYFPSYYLEEYYQQLRKISRQIVKVFKIKQGPIYFQFLLGSAGIKVNEIACRIGGAYEDIFIPYLSGFDILGMTIDAALGLGAGSTENSLPQLPRQADRLSSSRIANLEAVKSYNLLAWPEQLTVQLFFARPGKIASLTAIPALKRLAGVLEAGFNFKVGEEIPEIVNATQRAGYLLVTGQNKEILLKNLKQALDFLKIEDQSGRNLLLPAIGHDPHFPLDF